MRPCFAGGDLSNELVRHFLIECTQKGVRLKGCPNEPYFGENTAHAMIQIFIKVKHKLGEQHASS